MYHILSSLSSSVALLYTGASGLIASLPRQFLLLPSLRTSSRCSEAHMSVCELGRQARARREGAVGIWCKACRALASGSPEPCICIHCFRSRPKAGVPDDSGSSSSSAEKQAEVGRIMARAQIEVEKRVGVFSTGRENAKEARGGKRRSRGRERGLDREARVLDEKTKKAEKREQGTISYGSQRKPRVRVRERGRKREDAPLRRSLFRPD